ncbi:MAG: helix-turn-helix domain-containing protein [Rehaibacterium terrae]|uniref:helix-turn-helix domain-containing protein n=1 Tax=Rehaibacterium terrae TaxID=1341696 RepID=UPI00391877C8
MAMTAEQVGAALRAARQAQGLTLEALAERTGLSLRFLSELERGKEGASLGRVLRVAAALGLELSLAPRSLPLVDVERYPELRLLLWQRGQRFVDEKTALDLYEANWRFVDTARLLPREAALIRRLAERHGRGVLNV